MNLPPLIHFVQAVDYCMSEGREGIYGEFQDLKLNLRAPDSENILLVPYIRPKNQSLFFTPESGPLD